LPQKHNSWWTISKPPGINWNFIFSLLGLRSHHLSNLGLFWYCLLEVLIRGSILP
jgi:hypothetical protein